MQSSGQVGQTFQWVRPVRQTETFEVWDGQSSSGQPAIMVLVTPSAMNNQAVRALFVDAVRWAQRPDITDVMLLTEDAIGVQPWAAFAADQQGRAFAERLLGLAPAVSPGAAPIAPVVPVAPAAPPVPVAPVAPATPVAPPGSPVAPPGSPVAPPGSPVAPPGSPVAANWPPAVLPVPQIQPAPPVQPAPVHGPPAAPQSAPPPTAPWGQPPDPAQNPSASANATSLPWSQPVVPGPEHWSTQPSTAQPSTAQPSTAQPSTAQPSTAQPSTAQPSSTQPSAGRPAPVPQPWDGQAQPVRSPDIPPLPGPQDLAERRRRRARNRLRIAVVAGVVLVLAASAATAAFVLPGRAKDRGGPTTPPSASASASPSPTPSPQPTFQASAAPVAVLGTTWQPGDATKIQDFVGWPFAFRTPPEAACEFFVGEPDYKAYNCKWGTEPNHTVMAFVVRRCVNNCDATEQAQFETMTPWKPDGALAPIDATTKFVAVDYGDGREQFTMVHYFGTTTGGPPQWVVMVQGNTAKPLRDPVLKTINDVRSQTP